MQISNVYKLLQEDWETTPLRRQFNTTYMREIVLPLGKDGVLYVTGDKDELSKFEIEVVIKEKNANT